MTLTAFLAAWIIHLLAAASPGPAILLSARTAMVQGFRASLWLGVGVAIGAVVWAVAALFGLAILFKIAPALFWGFKVVGGLFLLWIAYNMWRHAEEPMEEISAAGVQRGPFRLIWLGLATQLANPKAAIFFGAVFVGTLPPGISIGWQLILLSMVFVNEFFCCSTVGRVFSFGATREIYVRMKAGIDRGFGGILGLLGVKIALS